MAVPVPAPPGPPDPRQRVRAAVARLDLLADRPPAEHVAVFEELHAALGDALTAPDGGSAGAE